MNNDEVFSGFQFDLELPEGVSIKKNAQNKYIMAATNRLKVYDEFEDTYVPTHNVECNQQSSGLYRVMVYSGFYIASNGRQYKSFLVLSENPARKGLVFVEDGESPTGVVNYVQDMTKNTEYRDLQGRLVKNPGKGVYVVDGKKRIIK
jgi:hypothetical protein